MIQFKISEAPHCVWIQIDHDVPGLPVVGVPLPRVVAALVPVEVLVDRVSGGRVRHHQERAPRVAAPPSPGSWRQIADVLDTQILL